MVIAKKPKMKKMGRPVKGRGSKVISLSIDRELLEKADRLVKKERMSRAALIGIALRYVLEHPEIPKA